METYHKIQTLFKRHLDGPKKGKMIFGEWTTPALEYLADNTWEFTEKVDGTNIRVHLFQHDGKITVLFGGRTDRAIIPKPLLDYLQNTFIESPKGSVGRFMIDNNLEHVYLYGEGYGPNIQGGGKYREEHAFVLFDVKIGEFWLERSNVNDIAAKLGIDSVPVIGEGTLYQAIDIVRDGYTFNNQGAIVRYGRGVMKSTWGDFEAEGIVARPTTPLFDRKGDRIITKIKGVDFKK